MRHETLLTKVIVLSREVWGAAFHSVERIHRIDDSRPLALLKPAVALCLRNLFRNHMMDNSHASTAPHDTSSDIVVWSSGLIIPCRSPTKVLPMPEWVSLIVTSCRSRVVWYGLEKTTEDPLLFREQVMQCAVYNPEHRYDLPGGKHLLKPSLESRTHEYLRVKVRMRSNDSPQMTVFVEVAKDVHFGVRVAWK